MAPARPVKFPIEPLAILNFVLFMVRLEFFSVIFVLSVVQKIVCVSLRLKICEDLCVPPWAGPVSYMAWWGYKAVLNC